MRVHDQNVTFNVFNAMKFPTDNEECFKVDLIDDVVQTKVDQLLRSDDLERALTGGILNLKTKKGKSNFSY